nr:hypothetical protein Iba_chr15aCG11970 [Ipomoea batatas]
MRSASRLSQSAVEAPVAPLSFFYPISGVLTLLTAEAGRRPCDDSGTHEQPWVENKRSNVSGLSSFRQGFFRRAMKPQSGGRMRRRSPVRQLEHTIAMARPWVESSSSATIPTATTTKVDHLRLSSPRRTLEAGSGNGDLLSVLFLSRRSNGLCLRRAASRELSSTALRDDGRKASLKASSWQQ